MGPLDCVASVKMQTAESGEVFSINMSSTSSLCETRRDIESQDDEGSRRHSYWWMLLVDLPLFLLLGSLVGLFELGLLPERQGGFYCGDPALSFTFNGDTVSATVLMLGTFFIALVVVFATEQILADKDTWTAKFQVASKNLLRLYRNYLLGLVFNLTIFEVMKAVTSSPRPIFFDICKPDTAATCNGTEYVSTFTCTSTAYSSWEQRDSYHSFPSGHTAQSVHCALFVTWYLQSRAFNWRHRTVFLVPLLQLLAITFAVVSSLTRITDHRHHWWDVTVGFALGVVTAYYSAAILCKGFREQKSETKRLQQSDKRLLNGHYPSSP